MFQTERGEHKGKESLLNTQFNYYLVLISISEVSHGEQRKLIRRRLHTPTRAIFNYSSPLRNNSNLRKNPRKDMFFYLCNSYQTHLLSIAMPLGRIKWFLVLLPFLFNLPMMSFSFIQEHKENKKRNFPLVKEIVTHAN